MKSHNTSEIQQLILEKLTKIESRLENFEGKEKSTSLKDWHSSSFYS
jgi:hypothetical protein